MGQIIERYELPIMRKEVDNLDVQIANRWKELRDGVYSEENIFSIYEKIEQDFPKVKHIMVHVNPSLEKAVDIHSN